MAIAKTTANASYMIINGNRVELMKCNTKFDPIYVEATDSSNYDPNSNTLWETQLAGKIKATIDIEGYFDLNSTNASLIPLCYSGTPFPAQVYINSNRKLFDGMWNLKNPEVDQPISAGGMVVVKGQLLSNGAITIS